MANINAGTLVVTLEGKDVNLSQLLQKIEGQMQKGATTAKNFDSTIASLTASEKRNESALAAYAQAQARFAEASGNSQLAVQRLVAAMQQLTPNTTAANSVLSQLQGTLNRQAEAATQAAAAQTKAAQATARAQAAQASEMQKGLSVVTNFAQSFQQLIGAYFVATQAAQSFAAAINAGNELEKAEASFRALSGDTANYEKNIAAARTQQDRFGGSLKDNIDGLSGFANLARRTGIDINELANTARALAIVDPAQGFKGASIALKEFYSGDITSLARRFEIPRDRLNELKELAETDAPAAFQKLQGVLAEFGISQSLLAGQANTTAVAYDKLAGSAADAFASIGRGLAELLKTPAQALGNQLKEIAAGIDALRQSGGQKLQIEETLISTASSAEQFNAKVQEVNGQVDTMVGSFQTLPPVLAPLEPLFNGIVAAGMHFNELTEAQLRFAQAGLQSGTSLDTLKQSIAATAVEIQNLENSFAIAPENINATREQLTAYEQAALQAAAASAEGATFANAMSVEIFNGNLSVEEGTTKLLAYVQGLHDMQNAIVPVTDAHDRHATAAEAVSTALGEQAIKSQEASVQADQLKALQADLARLGPLVASGHITAANAAAFLASQYHLASGEAEKLIALQAQIAGANAAAQGFGKGKGVSKGGLFGDSVAAGAQTKKDIDEIQKGQQQLLDAEGRLAAAKGDTARQIALLRQQQQGLNKDSAAFKNIEADILNIQTKADKAAKGKGKGGAKSPKLTDNEKLNNQLTAQQEKFDTKMEDLEAAHQQKLVDIIADFAEKQLEVQKENETLKRRSRFDFYTDLSKSQLSPIDKNAFSAAYEDAFKKAQEIAASGRAKLAQEFLALKQQHLQELKDLAEEEAGIRTDKDLSRSEKNAKLQELEARRKLLQDAQREEEQQLLSGGDKIQNEFNKRISDENQAYADQADKIVTAADRAGEAKIRNAERSKIVVDEENKALATQEAIYDRIRAKNGGVLPAGLNLPPQATAPTAAPPASVAPAPITAPEAIPIKSDTPLPVAAPEFLTVKQFDLFVVRDQGVIDAVVDQTIRIESKLDSLLQQAISSTNALGGKLDAIRGAINSNQRSSVKP